MTDQKFYINLVDFIILKFQESSLCNWQDVIIPGVPAPADHNTNNDGNNQS